MSNGYNSRLRPDVPKGLCGDPEYFDDEKEEVLKKKIAVLTDLVKNSNHLVIHTGAGISTSSGIPDFRGPKGVWTLEERGEKSEKGIDFKDAIPSRSHMALKALVDKCYVKYVITQNVDALHRKSGVPRDKLSELHGSVFTEICTKCNHEYLRDHDIGGVGLKPTGKTCTRMPILGKVCGGALRDNCLDWDNELPDPDVSRADSNHRKADLAICIGTSLRIRPAGNMPMKTVRKNGKPQGGDLVIINLQKTHLDRQCTLRFYARCDLVLERLCEELGVEIPEYKEVSLKQCKKRNRLDHIQRLDSIQNRQPQSYQHRELSPPGTCQQFPQQNVQVQLQSKVLQSKVSPQHSNTAVQLEAPKFLQLSPPRLLQQPTQHILNGTGNHFPLISSGLHQSQSSSFPNTSIPPNVSSFDLSPQKSQTTQTTSQQRFVSQHDIVTQNVSSGSAASDVSVVPMSPAVSSVGDVLSDNVSVEPHTGHLTDDVRPAKFYKPTHYTSV